VRPVIRQDFTLAVDRLEVLRMMGVPKRGGDRAANAPSQALKAYPRALDEALGLVAPAAVYVFCRVEDVPYHVVFKRASRLAFAVCTIGPAVEAEIARSSAAGDSLRALLLDAIGSVAVESVVRQTAEGIRAEAAAMGLKAGVRFSPGYGKWPLQEQRTLFSIVDGSVIGVGLNDSCIMEPRKSVSFAVRIGEDPDART
jgi:hypothetical protein